MTGVAMPPTRSGASTVHVAPLTDPAVDALCTLARSLAFECRRVDLAGCTSKSDFMARVARALDFPPWFGHNLDALFDCLVDLSWAPAPGYVVVLEHADDLAEASAAVLEDAITILRDAAEAWRTRGVPFRAFVSAPARP